jgi:RHS repeat-associated protein
VPRQAIQAPPALISPGDHSSVTDATLTFQWGAVPNVSSYEIIVDNNSGLGSPEINLTDCQNTTYTVNNYLPDNVYYWKVRAKLSNGAYTAWSETWQLTYHLPVLPAPVFVPLYRLYKSDLANGTRDHFYTANPVEKAAAISQKGYKDEGMECFVSDRNFLGGVPLYRLYWGEPNSHCFTTSEGEKDSKITQGYVYEGIACFLYGNLGEALVPVHRLRQSVDTYHFFVTTEKGEYQNAINTLGYIEDAIIGYVTPKGIKDPTAHSRFQGNYGGVDLGSGALRGLNSLDLTMKGRGPTLKLAHYYNSFNSNPYPMGRGWSHSLDSYTRESTDGSVYVYWGDGTVSFFLKNGNAYEDKMGNNDQLALVNDGVNYGHNLTRKDQTVYTFRKININPVAGGFLQDNFRIVLLSVTDWRGNTLTFNYEAAYGTLQTVSDNFGRSLEFEYLEPTPQHVERIYEKVDGLVKRQTTFAYNSDGTLATFSDAWGKTTTYTYDADRYLTSITYPKGNTVAFQYDEAKRVNSIQAGDDPASRIRYNPSPNMTEVTDPQNHVFQLSYNDFRLASAKNLTETTPEIIEYNDSLNPSKPTRLVDKKGNQTQYQYDAFGNVTRITNATGKIALYTYNDKNNLLTATEFHASGDAVTPTAYSYDTVGNRLRTSTNPENEVTWFYYDAQHQITSAKDGRNRTTYFGYDPYGNLASKRDALNNITQYDNDYAGRRTHVRDAELKDTWYTYDGNDNLIRVTDHYGHEVALVPDDNGNPSSVSWGNDGVLAATDYGYDDKDRLNHITNPLGVSTLFTYYSTGEVNTRRDFNNTTATYYYDANNRLQQIAYPDHSKTIGRDPNGTITSVTCQQGTTQFEFNELNLLKQYTDPYGNVVQYGYDNAGRIRTITYPGGKLVTYGYDQAGRLKTVQDWVGGTTTYQYDDSGNITGSSRPNNTEALYSYDDANRLVAITEKNINGTVICSYSVAEMDGVGNYKTLTAIEPLSPSPTPENTGYSYDKRSNRLLTSGSTTYTYDGNGNRKTSSADAGKIYSWDFENMLTAFVDSSTGKTVRHYYDGLGNRIARVDGSQTTHYVLDLSGDMSRVLAETDGSGNVIAYYVYGNGLISRISAANERRMYHYNYRGDTIALTDASGTITDAYAYDEYGRLLTNQGNTPNAFRFVGRHGVMDEGGHLYLMRARFYDAGVGRFLSEDPAGFGGGDWNIHNYVGDNPITRIDPEGKSLLKLSIIVVKLAYAKSRGDSLTMVKGTIFKLRGTGGGWKVSEIGNVRKGSRTIVKDFIVGKALDQYAQKVEGSKGEDAPWPYRFLPFGIKFIFGNVKSAGGDFDPNDPEELMLMHAQSGSLRN